jgi:hypothetical protein
MCPASCVERRGDRYRRSSSIVAQMIVDGAIEARRAAPEQAVPHEPFFVS